MCSLRCIVLAGLGGLMPTICKLAATYVTNPEAALPQWNLFFGLGLFFFIGAILAYAFTETDLRRAFILGIAAPAIITNIMAGANLPGKSVSNGASLPAMHGGIGLVRDAHAGEMIKKTPEKQLHVEGTPAKLVQVRIHFAPNIQARQLGDTKVQIAAVLKDGKEVALGSFTPAPDSVVSPFLPPNTVSILFREGGIVAKQEIPTGGTGPFDITVNLSFQPRNDFLWSLGYKREMALTGIQPQLR